MRSQDTCLLASAHIEVFNDRDVRGTSVFLSGNLIDLKKIPEVEILNCGQLVRFTWQEIFNKTSET